VVGMHAAQSAGNLQRRPALPQPRGHRLEQAGVGTELAAMAALAALPMRVRHHDRRALGIVQMTVMLSHRNTLAKKQNVAFDYGTHVPLRGNGVRDDLRWAERWAESAL